MYSFVCLFVTQHPSGGQGFLGLPMEAKDVTKEHLIAAFPPADILEKWYRGEDAEWPPSQEPEPVDLRFSVGAKVLCRVGPTEWAPGTVAQLWYRESAWQPGMYAPYKIHLEDGRDIFAPQDLEQVIRLNPDALNEQQQRLVRQQQQATMEEEENNNNNNNNSMDSSTGAG